MWKRLRAVYMFSKRLTKLLYFQHSIPSYGIGLGKLTQSLLRSGHSLTIEIGTLVSIATYIPYKWLRRWPIGDQHCW